MADTRFSELTEYSDGTDTTIQVPIIITDDGGTTWENYRFSLSRAMPYYLSASTGTVSIPAGRPVMARYYIQSTGSAITVSLTGETFPGGASSFTIEAGGFAEIVKTGVSAYSFVSASNGLLYNLQAKRLRASITQDSTDDGNVYAVIGQIELTAQYARWGGSIAIVSGGHANTAPSVTHVDLYARQEAAMNNDAVVSAHAWTVGAPAVEFSYTLTHTPTSSYVTLYAHRSANFVTASVTLLDYEAYLATDGWASTVWDSSSPAGIVDVPTTDIIMKYYSSTPAMDGTGSAGVSTQVARGDHVHPTDTSKADLASPAFTGTPTAPTASAGTDTTQIATTEFVQDAITLSVGIPAGFCGPYAGATAPTGWLLCDGSAVSRTTYALLFAAIGTTWGAGDGSTTFNLPDFREAAPVGVGTRASGAAAHDVFTLAQFKDDQAQHVTGKIGAQYLPPTPTGCFRASTLGNRYASGVDGAAAYEFDNSLVARTGTVTRGKRIGVNFIIKY